VFWPQGWAMEHVVSWIAGADEAAMLGALGAVLGTPFADREALTAHLLSQKSYAPTHESVAVTLMASAACRTRAAQLLNALCDLLRDPANVNTPLFARVPADSTSTTHVFRFAPL
jgi:putative ATP-dependent endonuclease of OLD family